MTRRSPRARRRTWGGLIVAVLSAVLAYFYGTREQQAPTRTTSGTPSVSGQAQAIDGDTLEVAGTRVRLYGVDAPEKDQTCRRSGREYACGQDALAALRTRVAGGPVACARRDTDRYGRTVAVCQQGGEDLNAWLVSRGLALAYREYGTDYVGQEDEARRAKRGLHAGTYVEPWRYRKGETRAAPTSAPPTAPYTSCAQARADGRAPVSRRDPGYNPRLDGDGDGRMCE